MALAQHLARVSFTHLCTLPVGETMFYPYFPHLLLSVPYLPSLTVAGQEEEEEELCCVSDISMYGIHIFSPSLHILNVLVT